MGQASKGLCLFNPLKKLFSRVHADSSSHRQGREDEGGKKLYKLYKINTNLIYFNNLIIWQKCINPRMKSNDKRM